MYEQWAYDPSSVHASWDAYFRGSAYQAPPSLGELDTKPHLSKGTSDLKQKCTQLATPFWGTVFHALSHGVIRFVRSLFG